MTVVDQTRLAIDGGYAGADPALPGEQRQMGDEEIAELTEVIRSGQLGRHGGTKVKELERAFAELYGVKHAVAVSSGSAAVHTAIATINPEPGRRDHHHPVQRFRHDPGHPVPERDPGLRRSRSARRFASTPASVEARITDRTRAILAVHLFGGLADVAALRRSPTGTASR